MKRKHLPALALILTGAVYVNLNSRQPKCPPCAVLAAQVTKGSAACDGLCAASAPEVVSAVEPAPQVATRK